MGRFSVCPSVRPSVLTINKRGLTAGQRGLNRRGLKAIQRTKGKLEGSGDKPKDSDNQRGGSWLARRYDDQSERFKGKSED